MGIKRHRPEEIVAKLRQVEVLVGQGMARIDAIRQVQITEQTFYRWRKQYGGMGTAQLKELKRLQKENELKTVRGIGVDEKTAVLVSPDGGSRTVGEGGAHFVEAEAPAEVLRGDAPLTHRRLTVQTTHNGENFDLSRWSGDGIEKRAMTVVDGELSISPW